MTPRAVNEVPQAARGTTVLVGKQARSQRLAFRVSLTLTLCARGAPVDAVRPRLTTIERVRELRRGCCFSLTSLHAGSCLFVCFFLSPGASPALVLRSLAAAPQDRSNSVVHRACPLLAGEFHVWVQPVSL